MRVSQYWDNIQKQECLPVLIFGTSGISKETYSVLNEINEHYKRTVFDFKGYVAECEDSVGQAYTGGSIVCSDESFEKYISQYEKIGVVIPLGTPRIKQKIYERISGYSNLLFPNIISPTSKAMLGDTIEIGMGNIICSGVIMTTDITIGDFNLINLNSTVGHDVIIRDFCVVNPLTAISGFAEIQSNVLVGAGVSIKEHTKVEASSVAGMGAIVCKDVQEGTIVVSGAAHVLEKKK